MKTVVLVSSNLSNNWGQPKINFSEYAEITKKKKVKHSVKLFLPQNPVMWPLLNIKYQEIRMLASF